MSTPRVLPVGRRLDLLPPADGRPGTGHLQLGVEVVELSGPAMLVWAACHALPTHPPDQPWGSALADQLAARWGVDVDARARGWAELSDVGAVTALEDDDDARRTWAAEHVLHPLLVGLGDTPELPGRFRIGLPEEPFVTLPLPLYELWAWGSLQPDLASAADWHAEGNRGAGLDDPDAVDADRLLAGLVAALHPLLSVTAACLDRAP